MDQKKGSASMLDAKRQAGCSVSLRIPLFKQTEYLFFQIGDIKGFRKVFAYADLFYFIHFERVCIGRNENDGHLQR